MKRINPYMVKELITAHGASGSGPVNISIDDGSIQTWTLDASCTFNLPTGITPGNSFTMFITTSGTSRTLTLAAPSYSIWWSNAAAPNTSSDADGTINAYTFMTLDGNNWFGFISGVNLS